MPIFRNNRNDQALVFALLILSQTTAQAYELATHAFMAQKAYEISDLAASEVQSALGIDRYNENVGQYYYDFSLNSFSVRSIYDFEFFRMPPNSKPRSISGWIMRGAVREDDIGAAGEPLDDPSGKEQMRLQNHFYDPVYDVPITYPPIFAPLQYLTFGTNYPTPAWAIGSVDRAGLPTTSWDSPNHFTILTARESMYRALTGLDSNRQKAPVGNIANTEEARRAYWATVIRCLGGIVHLLQDMAQPQHTRNESHVGNPTGNPYNANNNSLPQLGHKSIYELFGEQAVWGFPYLLPDGTQVPTNNLVVSGYPIPKLNDYYSYFTTRHIDSDVMNRKGLADYSNRGFFTNAKNFGEGTYSFPVNHISGYNVTPMLVNWSGKPLPAGRGWVLLYSAPVPDSLNPSQTGVPAALTTWGTFDEFLTEQGFRPKFTLNWYNYTAMLERLVPRAVAYSAGLINYFFRAKLDVVPEQGPPGAGKWLRVKNLHPTETMKGNFEFFYDAVDGKRYPVPLSQIPNLVLPPSNPGDPQSGHLFYLTPPSQPDAKNPGEYILVFNGDMGNEKSGPGVVGAVGAKVFNFNRLEGLYLVGETADRKLVTMKVDRRGTIQLSGPDAQGKTVVTDEWDAFKYYRRSTPTDKMVLHKQVEFIPGVNGMGYRTRSASIVQDFAFFVQDGSQLRNDLYFPAGVYLDDDNSTVKPANSYVWWAKSPDPKIGSFVFRPNKGPTGKPAFWYTRFYQNNRGDKLKEESYVDVPDDLDVSAFYRGEIAISADGLKLDGFVKAEEIVEHDTFNVNNSGQLGDPLYVRETVRNYDRMRDIKYLSANITLLAKPAVSVVVSNTAKQSFSSKIVKHLEEHNTSPVQFCFAGCFVRGLEHSTKNDVNSQISNAYAEKWLGYINNQPSKIVTYSSGSSQGREYANKQCTYGGLALDKVQDVVLFGTLNVHTELWSGEDKCSEVSGNEDESISSYTMNFSNGNSLNWNLQTNSTGIVSKFDSVEYYRVDWIYNDWDHMDRSLKPKPRSTNLSKTPATFSQTGNMDATVRYFLDGTAANIIKVKTDSTGESSIFRGVTYAVPVVADSSPLGEIFFAASDLSAVVHEPLNNRMPKVQLPPHVIKLLGAAWL